MSRSIRRLLIVLVLIIVAGTGYRYFLQRENRGLAVQVEKAAQRDVFRSYVTASGEIVATRYADIGSSVMGKIVDLPVREGQQVRQGDLLARIDPVQAAAEKDAADKQVMALTADMESAERQVQASESQLQRTRALLADRERTLDRMRQLFSKGVSSQADVDQAKVDKDTSAADLAVARAELERSQSALNAARERLLQSKAQLVRAADTLTKTEVRAPMSGIVSRLQVRLGEMVVIGIQNQPGTTLMTISDLSGVNAEVKVAEADILRIKPGQQATVTLDAVSDRRFNGEVIEVGTSALAQFGVGAAAREFKVVIRVQDPDPGFRPGLTCDTEILTDEIRQAVTVPLQAVVLRTFKGEEQSGVFVPEGRTARFVPVKAGIIGGLDISIDGVSPGTEIITGPFQVLRDLDDGMLVDASRAEQS
ncbi:MAG: efflux RND transporter periplasmic adaptor subunit [Acidobacteriota bacterium]